MPRKRSRPNTEAKFLDAVLDLVAESGCGALGVNAVAQKAGADKVLIYRYFGDLDGLLTRVAEQQTWLPPIDEITNSLEAHRFNPADYLSALFQEMVQHIRSEATAHQLIRWRKTARNPLTNDFSHEWKTLWNELPKRLATALDHAACESWAHACTFIALMVEAELNDESVDLKCIHLFASTLPALKVDA